jgi:putative ABC transport system permease protein
MDFSDIIWIGFQDLKEKKVRTALTVIMVIIGIAAIIALTSFTAGINNSISSQLQALGPTAIIVSSSGGAGFSVADVAKISSLPNVTSVTPLLTGSGNLYAGSQNTSITLIGVTPQGLAQLIGGNVAKYIYQGAVFNDNIAPDALVGHSVAFPSSAAGQQTIIIGQSATLKLSGRGGQTLTVPVVGILQSYGGLIIPIDSGVIVSLQAAEVLLHRSSFNEMFVLASNTSSVNATSSLITSVYGSGARVLTTAQIQQTASTIIGSISLLFSVIAGVSLLVAAIGIMNIMLIAVLERTHDIGIMKSVGFKNRDVMLLFLFQALLIGLIGGLLGVVTGAGISYSLAGVFGGGGASTSPQTSVNFRGGGGGGAAVASTSSSLSFTPAFPIATIITALLVSVIVSVAAGLYPAWRASKMQPIDALRQL